MAERIAKGTLVEIQRCLLQPGERAPQVPGDTRQVPLEMRESIRSTLLTMDSDIRGKALLASLELERFAQVNDADYDPIREMWLEAQQVPF